MFSQTIRRWFAPACPTRRPRQRPSLTVDALEHREMPVVGAFSVPTPLTPSDGYTGVVKVFTGGGMCSGSLLYTGRHILTAAHCVDDNRDSIVDAGVGPITVQFDLPDPADPSRFKSIVLRDIAPSAITVHPDWGSESVDLAIIRLPEIAPAGADRYQIYRSSDETGQVFVFAGYGMTGTGSPTDGPDTFDGLKRIGANRFEDVNSFHTVLGADFDDGTAANNRFGDRGVSALISPARPGESMANFGDSGGPAFLGGRIAGVTHWLSGFSSDAAGATSVNFGATGAWARVSTAAAWIDSTVAGRYELVVDMTHQPTGNTPGTDVLQVQMVLGQAVVSLNGVALHYDTPTNLIDIVLKGSGDVDSFIVSDMLGLDFYIDGRGGRDILTGPNVAAGSDWYIVGFDSGTLDPRPAGGPVVRFSSVEHLQGHASSDRFIMYNGAGVSGSIDGGAGTDTIDYSRYLTGIQASLFGQFATNVGAGALGALRRIENVVGGAGGDRIWGDDLDNVLYGNGGIDFLYGGAGNDWLYGGANDDQLFGEAGLDRLDGEGGNDYLDGGFDGVRDELRGNTGSDTFVDNQTRALSWNPLTGTFEWVWDSEDLLIDFVAGIDWKEVRR